MGEALDQQARHDQLEHLAPIELQPGLGVVHREPEQRPDEHVVAEGQDPAPPRVGDARPAVQLRADHDVGAVRDQRVVQDRELARMNVEVGVHEQHELAPRELRAADECPALAGVAVQAHEPHVVEAHGGLLRPLDCPVDGPVVDQQDLVGRAERRHRRIGLAHGASDPFGLVEGRDDDRDALLARGHGREGYVRRGRGGLGAGARPQARGPCLLAPAAVAMQRAALDRPVDAAHQLAVVDRGALAVPGGNRLLQAPEIGLHAGGVAAVLEALALGALDPLLLRMDVGHDSDSPRSGPRRRPVL